ncbi:GIP, partial [Symbiodinium microadriaticum]
DFKCGSKVVAVGKNALWRYIYRKIWWNQAFFLSRPPGFRDSRTYGDYGFERPPGLEARTDGPIPELPRDPVPVGDDGRRHETGGPAGGSTGPSAMDVLITGMGQLQQVLLRKNDIVDLEPKAVSELVKLPEYTAETGAIDFQDYLYLAEQQIGTLASGAGDWWSRTLSVAQQAYAEYQTLSPVRRLNVVPHLTEDLRDDKYKKLERKVAALVLASLPKGVRDDLVAYRVQGVHHILYRLMVIFQPGGAQDRAQLLKQLDVTESAQGPAEATTALRRWYRLLQRASDLGVKLPDESLQVRALSVIVKRTSEQNADFKFRLALARTELQIDTRPTQENVLRYLQHLLAELEQLGAVTRKASSATAAASSTTTPGAGAATTTTTGGASLKGLAPVPDAKAKAKSIPTKKVCSWFGTDSGCRNGKACNFQHQWAGLNRGERCLLCGSKQHRAKECPTATSTPTTEKPQSPTRAAKLQSTSSAATPAQSQVADQGEGSAAGASGAASSVASGAHNKIDAAKVTEILSETNKMLKALTTPQQPPREAAPLDPFEMIQKQLDEVRRLRTLVVRAPVEPSPAFSSAVSWYETRLQATAVAPTGSEEEDEALLDSGASHAFRPPVSQEELLESRRVGVSLATGEERRLPQNPGGTLLSEDGRDATILPMGQLVTLLGCRVSWTPSKLTVVHPVHGKLQVRLRGHCPVLPVTQALSLISELEQKRMESFERTVQDLQLQVKALKEKGMQGWSWEQHLRAFAEQGDRTHLAGLLHKNPVFSTVKAEALLGVPEDIPLGNRDGWNLLKGMPWSRAKRKAMHQSDGWVVHLFSGDERAERGKSRLDMKRSFWSDALTGNDVLVEVDVTTSRSLDFLQRDGVFRVLAWGALTGRIKAIVGGPPRQTFPTTADGLVNGAQHQREVQLVVRMMTLYYLAQQGRTLRWHNGGLKSMVKPHVGFLLEHPYTREGGLVSLFQMPLWKMFALDNMMGEVPCVVNERNVVLGGNLNLWHLRDERLGLRESMELGSVWPFELTTQVVGAIRSWVGLRNHESLLASLMRTSWVQDGETANLNKFNAHDWRLHVQRDHLPYRRDCRECIERASGKPHRKVGHPTPCTLSIDTAGPFRTKGAGGYKYLLVGCYRHPILKGTSPEDEEKPLVSAEEVKPPPDDGHDWILEEEEVEPEEAGGGVGEVDPGESAREVEDVPDEEVEALRELAEPVKFVSIYLARPLRTRKKAEALKSIQEMYIQLRSSGFPLNRLHMDRAREFQSGALEHWAAARDIDLSRTQGSDPAQNGTAERAVGYLKMRMRILLAQAKELSGLADEVVKTFWPMAADTAVAQQQSMALGRKFPSAARFGSRVFTKRKGYGTGGSFDLKSKWIGGVYLGPARTVPGGHLVYTDENNLWFTTNIRQFEDRGGFESTASKSEPDLLPARRVKGKTSVVELASGSGLMPGLVPSDGVEPREEEPVAQALAKLTQTEDSESEDDIWSWVSGEPSLYGLELDEPPPDPTTTTGEPAVSVAQQFLDEEKFTMEDCLAVLEAESLQKPRKLRTRAWRENGTPPIHTTFGAYQRGPFVGLTNATNNHEALTRYLVKFMKKHSNEEAKFTSFTVAKDLFTEVHSDRFNMRNSVNYVLTLGDFQGGGVWQQGESDEYPMVSVEAPSGEILSGYVMPVKNRVVQVNPKMMHRTMPWTGGPKWTVIAHTIGAVKKLTEGDLFALENLGFPLGQEHRDATVEAPDRGDEVHGGALWRLQYSQWDVEEEMLSRIWTRRVLDEEEQLAKVVPDSLMSDYCGVVEANGEAAEELYLREGRCLPERFDEEQWLGLCRMTETEEETFGVETMLEELQEPLKVVFTVALEEVKQYAGRWAEAIHKEAKALLDAGALVPLTAEEQADLERSGRLVVLPAKGVFTVKPPELERLVDEDGRPFPKGSPRFVKRKARLVICGNFQGRQAKEDSYAGGCQIDSLRTMLVLAASKGWQVASTDIRNAFILAPIKDDGDDDDDTVYGLFPPRVFQLVCVPCCYQLWRVDRALYGFRRSPRLWSKFRDKRLRAARIPHGDGCIMLRQCKADENVWAIVLVQADGSEAVRGYMNIYVDDVLYVGSAADIRLVQEWLTSEWKASDLTWASETEIIRFLGLEIGLFPGGVRIGQQAYVDELIRHHKLQDARGYMTPCPQEWLLGECEDVQVEYTPEQLRRAQVLTGELLWLSGRSRPDLMHSVATMSCLCIKNPELVERIGQRVLGYLKATAKVCLWYKPDTTTEEVIGYSDASFAPQGSRSVGCSTACFLNCPVSWRCGRQSLVALSVAEAELIEAVNCVQMMLGLACFAEELWPTALNHCLKAQSNLVTWGRKVFIARDWSNSVNYGVFEPKKKVNYVRNPVKLGFFDFSAYYTS